MAFGKKKSGLDLSGVNRRGPSLSGGSAKRGGGLSFAGNGRNAGRNNRGSIPRQMPGLSLNGPRKTGMGRSKLPIILVVVFAILLATGVGFIVYKHAVKNAVKADLDTEALAEALYEPEGDLDPYWCVVNITDAENAEKGRGAVEDLAMLYVDPDNKSCSFLWIPASTRVYVAGYGYKSMSTAFQLTEAEEAQECILVSAAQNLTGVKVSHYLELNQAGYEALVDGLGNLSADISDASCDTCAATICKKIFGASSENLSTYADLLSTDIATDLARDDIYEMVSALQGMNMDTEFHQADMPVSSTDSTDQYTIVDKEPWQEMIERVNSGTGPVATDSELSNYEVMRENNVITIWNGVGVSGIAADCANHLKEKGWTIESTGNAASFVYSETLVVYKYDDDKALADLVVSDLGQGRAVRSAARYSFEGNILVVVGQDYQPY